MYQEHFRKKFCFNQIGLEIVDRKLRKIYKYYISYIDYIEKQFQKKSGTCLVFLMSENISTAMK